MKKILLVAVFTAIGLTSCEADGLNDSNNQIENVHADNVDNTPIVEDDDPNEGPGDDVIIIIPPKKP